MAFTEAASFLNLDLKLESRSDLSALALHMAGRALVFFKGSTADGFQLTLEPIIEGTLNSDAIARQAVFDKR